MGGVTMTRVKRQVDGALVHPTQVDGLDHRQMGKDKAISGSTPW